MVFKKSGRHLIRLRRCAKTSKISKTQKLFFQMQKWYRIHSTKNPFITASLTSGLVLISADLVAQKLTNPANTSIDYRRTFALGCFGLFYYGFVAKKVYLSYDKIFGKGIRAAHRKTCVELMGHTPLMFIPAFYLITCSVKGMSFGETFSQLKREYLHSTLGTIGFWAAPMWINFAYVPQVYRILIMVMCSFFHKIGLSWFSNRDRLQQRISETSSTTLQTMNNEMMIMENMNIDNEKNFEIPPINVHEVQEILVKHLPPEVVEVLHDINPKTKNNTQQIPLTITKSSVNMNNNNKQNNQFEFEESIGSIGSMDITDEVFNNYSSIINNDNSINASLNSATNTNSVVDENTSKSEINQI